MIWLLKALAKCIAILPKSFALALGRGIGRILFWLIPKKRKQTIASLTRCFPDRSASDVRAMACRVFQNMVEGIAELLRWIGKARIDPVSEVAFSEEDLARLKAYQDAGGCLCLTAHVGNFDMLAMWGARYLNLYVIVKYIKNKGVNAFITELRERAGVHLLPAKNAYRDALRAVKKNGTLGFINDQNMIVTEGIFVDFFGKPACTSPGLAMLSAQLSKPVLPIFLVRENGVNRILLLDEIPAPADRSKEAILAATQAYTKSIEDVIRQYPEQWIWMHNRWRTQPSPRDQAP